MFSFSLQLLSETCLVLKRTERDVTTNVFTWSTRFSCQVLIKLSRQIFEKHTNIKFHENPSSGSRVVNADGQMDGRMEDMTKPKVVFQNFAKAPKIEPTQALLAEEWNALGTWGHVGWYTPREGQLQITHLFRLRYSPTMAQAASLLRFLDHTQIHTPGRTPLDVWSVRCRGRYLHNTQQSHQTNIHALSGIRTRDPSY